ncbi:terminase family protein [Ruminiclostridium papyrosolvens DSM 2782]|uniref:terminase large subunit domain-containing protein n=1 Tax=Ruminiclostridium papyrosolvens TaxID=29362 RepID=UPI0023E43F18|nr:terminase family protein [Ruminiclostridium papyrosolvens]WES36603.1 terminase family protein [Ruminiclostridium papyrosolvens DSM 2782]WES36605.1 terminase family protein [Ruminiclostridium papyrosolvens DSM 2782]
MGGKSFVQLVDAMIFAINHPGSKQLILRETFPELERSLIMTSLTMYPSDQFQYNAGEHRWYHLNGSTIEFGYLESYTDVSKYQSAEYDIIRIDEGTHMDEARITYMKSRIRGANGYPKQMKISTNPGGIGHKFLKKRFRIGVENENEIFTDYVGKDKNGVDRYITRCYIPAKVYDNIFLMEKDPNYITNLMQLPERERDALLEGSWDIFDDQAFPEFDPDIHTYDPEKTFKNGQIPKHWKRWRSADNGYDDPFAFYWHAIDEHGHVWTYREYTRSEKDPKVAYKDQAAEVVSRSTYLNEETGLLEPEKILYTVIGHDAFFSNERLDAKSIEEFYNEGGLYGFVPTATDRKLRTIVAHEYLKPYFDENIGKMTAKWHISKNCKVLIEKLPDAIKDPKDNEKYLDKDDHQLDGAFYGILSHHSKKTRPLPSEKTELQKHKEKALKKLKRQRR